MENYQIIVRSLKACKSFARGEEEKIFESLEGLRGKVEGLERDAKESSEKLSTSIQRERSFQDQITAKETQVNIERAEWKAEIESLKQAHLEEIKRADKQHNERRMEQAAEILALQKEKSEIWNRFFKSQGELLTAKNSSLHHQNATTKAERLLEIEIKKVFQQAELLKETNNKMSSLEIDKTALRDRIDMLLNENSSLDCLKFALEMQKTSLQEKIDSLNENKSALETSKMELCTEKRILQDRVAQLSQENSEYQASNTILGLEKGRLQDRTESLSEELSSLLTENGKLHDRVDQLLKENSRLEDCKSVLQEEKKASEDRVGNLLTTIATMESCNSELRLETSTLHDRTESLSEEVSNLRTEKTMLRNRLDHLLEENSNLEACKSQLEVEKNNLQDHIASISLDLSSSLQEQLTLTTAENGELQSERSALIAFTAFLQCQQVEKDEVIKRLEEDTVAAQDQIQSLQTQLAEVEINLLDMKKEVEKLQKEKEAIYEELKNEREENGVILSEKSALEEQLASVKAATSANEGHLSDELNLLTVRQTKAGEDFEEDQALSKEQSESNFFGRNASRKEGHYENTNGEMLDDELGMSNSVDFSQQDSSEWSFHAQDTSNDHEDFQSKALESALEDFRREKLSLEEEVKELRWALTKAHYKYCKLREESKEENDSLIYEMHNQHIRISDLREELRKINEEGRQQRKKARLS